MNPILNSRSLNEFDYSDDSFEEFEELENQEIIEDLPYDQTSQTQTKTNHTKEAPGIANHTKEAPGIANHTKEAQSIDQNKLFLPVDKCFCSAIDIIDNFILSQIDHLNQLKQMAIQRTINK
jgi:hypothetical protein